MSMSTMPARGRASDSSAAARHTEMNTVGGITKEKADSPEITPHTRPRRRSRATSGRSSLAALSSFLYRNRAADGSQAGHLQERCFLCGMSGASAARLRALGSPGDIGGSASLGYRFFAQAGAVCAVSQTRRFMLWDGRLPLPDHDGWSNNGGGYDV
jgi:hypothetical protein